MIWEVAELEKLAESITACRTDLIKRAQLLVLLVSLLSQERACILIKCYLFWPINSPSR